jgi:hypothetical protein
MSTNPEKVEELRASANQLAKQALETAELGLRLVRGQLETVSHANPNLSDVQKTVQNTAFTVEAQAKEMFSLATRFMTELNDKWQPGTAPSAQPKAEEKPKAEKINIEMD